MMKRCSPSDCSSPVGLGYTKINLPLLRRCISDPTHSPPDLNSDNFNSSSPSPTRSSLPPRAPPSASLRRSVSDLNPSPASNNSPNSKRLKRMKGRLKEMSEWCMQLMQEEDEQEEDDDEEGRKNEGPTTPDVPEADTIPDANPNDTSTEGSSEKEFSESVSVEKKDDSLVIHFRCHCDKACQFLLNGTDCYYKVL